VYTGLSGVTAGQWLLRANGHLQQQLMRARARRSQARALWRTGHSTVHVRCATGHPESALIPFVSFGDLDNNTFKGLTSLLSVE
jgi:hypothetical protein